MNLVAIADTHGRLPEIPECDALIIAGDFCPDFTSFFDAGIMRLRQTDWLEREFAAWEQTVPAEHILITPGNHDWIARLPENCRSRLLIDEEVEVWGFRFYFTPWVPPVMQWNYMLTRELRRLRFAEIPRGLDVLVSHGPPHMVLDRGYDGEHLGCQELRQRIQITRPTWNVFGHIHEGRRRGGPAATLGATECVNVAMWGKNWTPFSFTLP